MSEQLDELASLSMAVACVCWLGVRHSELAEAMRDELVGENGWSAEQWNQALDSAQVYAERQAGRPPDYQRWRLPTKR